MLKTDTHLASIFRRIKEELRENKPVQAFMFLEDLETYLYREYGEKK